MQNFKIIPVLDILNSKAVHAVRGEREKYKSLKSYLIENDDPISIIKLLNLKFNFSSFYIADLDAIMKNKPNFKILNEISKMEGIEIMIDPGISIYDDVLELQVYNIKYMIIGLETLISIENLKKIINLLGNQKIILSIDMYKEKLLTKINSYQNENPLKIIKLVQTLSIDQILLLDLYKVGQKLGGISSLYLDIRKHFDGDIYIGGGIKSFEDIELFYRNDFSGVLIGTALYDGSIDPQKLSDF